VKFLVDNQLPTALARWLKEKGHDAVHVLDRGQGQASDRELWSDVVAESRIMVSKDEDFFILATRPGDAGRLLWLRIGNCRKQALLETLERSWVVIEQELLSGQQIVELR
jgi:predicted nuclease of predicted toxin-antitoxin system